MSNKPRRLPIPCGLRPLISVAGRAPCSQGPPQRSSCCSQVLPGNLLGAASERSRAPCLIGPGWGGRNEGENQDCEAMANMAD
eukprot:CAMPEP_0181411776 /NCGR_PEP_ID=MMETSP1110-20121109/8067_1 /TAXON_ID=174948 /ORGANISM="Symbiodinium sp., Strain CCMP421" /LENGTH=82 /DNA_ID=CAMNT_0023534441 /DNA_START=310 /DNA_END=558 /DNA_ORIENTATION=+